MNVTDEQKAQLAEARRRIERESRARVIVIQQPMIRVGDIERPAFDFGPAEQFGEVEILAPNGKDILTPDVFRDQLYRKLEDFDPEKDYIIAAGDYTVLFLVGMMIGERYGSARILRWVSSAKAYQPLILRVGPH